MKQSILKGIIAATLLLGLYFALMLLFTGKLEVALEQLANLWWGFALVISGFGTQVGMASYLKVLHTQNGGAMTPANTGISSVSMLACCAHHVTDVALFSGLTGLGLLLVRYQTWLILLAVVTNWGAVFYLLSKLRRHHG